MKELHIIGGGPARLAIGYHAKKNKIPMVSIVGYTNAGKSTLLNSLTGTKAYAADELFATVESLQRELILDDGDNKIIISDTVGFIQNLPTTLIESFKSTLEVAKDADLLLHVVDAAAATYSNCSWCSWANRSWFERTYFI